MNIFINYCRWWSTQMNNPPPMTLLIVSPSFTQRPYLQGVTNHSSLLGTLTLFIHAVQHCVYWDWDAKLSFGCFCWTSCQYFRGDYTKECKKKEKLYMNILHHFNEFLVIKVLFREWFSFWTLICVFMMCYIYFPTLVKHLFAMSIVSKKDSCCQPDN